MKTINNIKQGSRQARSLYKMVFKSVFFSTLLLTGMQSPLLAQVVAQARPQAHNTASGTSVIAEPDYDTLRFAQPSWWFGVAGGANFNFYRGTTQRLNDNLTVPTAFRHGMGVGLYIAPAIEFHRPDSRWGVMLQGGYDSRKGKFEQVTSPCNCPQDLSTNLSYITIEPSLRFAPFKSSFYLYAGPRFAFSNASAFTYKQGINPEIPDQAPSPDVKSSFSAMNSMLMSMQIGAGYDIQLSSDEKQLKTVLSPFISYQPYFGQDPRSIETWTVTTVRAGAVLKFGRGKRIDQPAKTAAVIAPQVKFSVQSPANVPVERRMRETFPVRNYVFFDLGSTQIPDRYVLLTKDQVKDFKEDRLETFTPKRMSGRAERQMTVYYNVLNILGERMQRNPEANVRLTGASMEGEKDAIAMAESVKKYLVDVFGIAPARIKTEGRAKPRIADEQKGGTQDLTMIREGDHRVSIWSESPALLLEYQTGPDVPLAPVELVTEFDAPVDSYVKIHVKGAREAFTSWSLEVKDDQAKVLHFGPYTEEEFVSIPGRAVLGERPSGNYKITMIGQNGTTVRKDTTVRMVLWTPPKDEMGIRYSVLYEYNDSDAILAYQKYLTDVVAPKIPKNATVIIHGYTDTIGDAAHNQELSLARANDVRGILERSMEKAGRKDVKFESYGFGEDANLARYENNYPEERFYNRGVVVDIIPKE